MITVDGLDGSLGMRATITSFLQRLELVDLEPIVYKLTLSETGEANGGWPLSVADAKLRQYKQYLLLVFMYPERRIAPSHCIDRVWHEHIMDTEKYSVDMRFLFGAIVHHFPYFGIRNKADNEALKRSYEGTQALFALHFGERLERLEHSLCCDSCCRNTGPTLEPATLMPEDEFLAASAELARERPRPERCLG